MTSFGLPDNVCICLNLRKGGKAIAGLCIAISLLSFVLLVIYLASDFDKIAREIGDNNDEMVQKLKENRASAHAIAWTLLLTSIGLLVSSIVLIRGIQTKSQKQIIPFLAVVAAAIIITSVIAIIQFKKGLFFAVATLVIALIYFFICIYSLYKQLDAAVLVTRDVESY